jgi:hypothetical protein
VELPNPEPSSDGEEPAAAEPQPEADDRD